jgi:porin
LNAKFDRSLAAFGGVAARAIVALQFLVHVPQALGAEVGPVPPPASLLVPGLAYDGTALDDLHGGARTGSAYVGNLHLKLTAQGETIGWPGTSAFVDVLAIQGGHPSSLVGDAQGVSNLEGPIGTQVEELWLQHNFKDSGVSVLAGIYDLNSEFYRLTAAGLFLNGSFGIGPEFAQSGVEGPSIFPRTSVGIRFAFKPTSNTVVRTAVLDGVPVVRPDGSWAVFRRGDGVLTVAEFAVLTRDGKGPSGDSSMRDRIGRFSALVPYDDKLALGAWRYSSRLPDLSDTDPEGNPQLRRGSSGAYAIGERLVAGGGGSSGKRLAAFAQAGIADPRTNRFSSYLGAGIVASGWGLVNESDQFGASIARANNGSHYMRMPTTQSLTRAETTIELSYLTKVSKYLTVQPDLQYVIRPNTDPSIANAWVLQLRFEVAF